MEDFLTEALADLLNRMPPTLAARFVAEVLLRPDQARAMSLVLSSGGALVWRTQVQITSPRRGVIDLLALVGDRPLVVVESKIQSGIRIHGKSVDSVGRSTSEAPAQLDVEIQTQLTTYRAWLSEQRRDQAGQGAVVLMTHATAPPPEYVGSSLDPDDGPLRSACSWRDVARWLRATALQTDLDTAPAWLILASELASFLAENGMNPDLMGSRDLATLHLYVESADRITATFELIGKACAGLIAASTGQYGPEADTEGGVYWAWVYPKVPHAPGGAKWFVGWGVRFPEASMWWANAEPALPKEAHAFLHIGSDSSRVPLPLSSTKLPVGWSRSGADLVIAKPLSAFISTPAALAEGIGQWASNTGQEALALMREMAGTGGASAAVT